MNILERVDGFSDVVVMRNAVVFFLKKEEWIVMILQVFNKSTFELSFLLR